MAQKKNSGQVSSPPAAYTTEINFDERLLRSGLM